MGGHGKGVLPEYFKSRTVWANNMHWLCLVPSTMVKNKQEWRCAPSVVKRQDGHSGTNELPHSAFTEVPNEALLWGGCHSGEKNRTGWDLMDHSGQFIFLRSQSPLRIDESYFLRRNVYLYINTKSFLLRCNSHHINVPFKAVQFGGF